MGDDNADLFGKDANSPGEQIRERLGERGWTQEDLATITGRSRQQIIDLVAGRRGITTEMALALALAFNTSAGYWLNLDTAHKLATAPTEQGEIGTRARLFSAAPIREMQKRGWVVSSKDFGDVQQDVLKFFGAETVDSIPPFSVATRRSAGEESLTPAQRAWCFRARQLASAITVNPFDRAQLHKLKNRLRELAAFAANAEKIAEVLSSYGIRFVIIEPLSGALIDGAAFWLDEASPVIALSLRYDRLDGFWFTLMHEIAHIEHGDALSVDTDLVDKTEMPPLMKDEVEIRADNNAAAALIPLSELESFVRRVGPAYSKQRIIQFAHRIKIHPAIIVGQLQHRGEISFGAYREMLVKIRDRVIQTALTDGWGHRIAPGV